MALKNFLFELSNFTYELLKMCFNACQKVRIEYILININFFKILPYIAKDNFKKSCFH